MRRCSAFVAVVNRRRDVSRFFCSRFVLYEYGLSIQARRPRLLLIDERVGSKPFGSLAHTETHYFSIDRPDAQRDELTDKIERLKRVSKDFPNRLGRPRGSIAVLVSHDQSSCSYAEPKVLERIKEAADLAGFAVDVLKVPCEHNAFFALSLDEYEAIVLDVRGTELPEWVFAYAYGRLVPTIKLVRVLRNEIPANVPLPALVQGLRMDEDEPGVELVTYWRDIDDLVWQLSHAFAKLDEPQTDFKEGRRGEVYFESIGRRPARVFISNAAKANALGRRLSEELRLRNIERFQYKEPDAIPTGTDWQATIRREVQACDIFVAIIGEGYRESTWCMEETKSARAREIKSARARSPNPLILPYRLDQTRVGFMRRKQVPDLPTDQDAAVKRILEDIQKELTRKDHGTNRRLRRTMLLGASRELVIDAIRHVSRPAWQELLSRLRGADITTSTPTQDGGPVRSRTIAEQLFMDVQRADIGPSGEKSLTLVLAETLADLAPLKHKAGLGRLAARIADRPSDDNA